MPNVRTVIVGDGLDRAELEALNKAQGLEHRVRFIGFQQGVSSVYAALDLVVIPSFSEGQPLVLLEALLHESRRGDSGGRHPADHGRTLPRVACQSP